LFSALIHVSCPVTAGGRLAANIGYRCRSGFREWLPAPSGPERIRLPAERVHNDV
jgi:hypothetical protein